MKKAAFTLLLMLPALFAAAQLLETTPFFPKDNDNLVITLDASMGNRELVGYNSDDVYVHIGLITSASADQNDWKYVPFGWATTPAAAKAVSLGNNRFQYTINNVRQFFNVPVGETIQRIAILFRSGDGNRVQRNADQSNMYLRIYGAELAARFTVPFFQPKYIPVPETINKFAGDNFPVTGVASASSAMKLYLNGAVIQSAANATTISANPVLVAGNAEVVVEADNGTTVKKDTVRFFVGGGVTTAPLPAGVKDGINYAANNTEVTLVLFAPGKTRICVTGEFPGGAWTENAAFQMNKTPDGQYWWKTITGLTPGTEYAFQYLIDGTLRVGDPYSEKVLDKDNDPFISAATYPGLRAYPAGQSGIVSIVQTAAPVYNWRTTGYARPDKRNLVEYELLVRDFLSARNWNTLRDTLNYLQRMGINAIELMPVNEFDGNLSWGYNPAYFLAPDKYYGTKNAFKEFIDTCHGRGIAVIMDIALNHATGACPLAAMWWNGASNQTAADNPYFNVVARHPFNVFHDFNHEAAPTKYFFKRVVEHWLTEYKIDGFRFDLSKGFTQFNSGSNVELWGKYDASRVAIWKAYYDTLQRKSPGSYAILEHFAENPEEQELADYGMLFWGNHNKNFSQAAMGYSTPDPEGNTWNFEGGIHTVRNWTKPHLMTYMESHDEERMMYRAVTFGNSAGSYNTKDTTTALKRMELSAAFFYSIPGPKMIWQFGETGYDYSITSCHPGNTIPQPYPSDNCRTSEKPIRWDYRQQARRTQLYNVYAKLGQLRGNWRFRDVFTANETTIERDLAGAFKWIRLRSASDTSDIMVIGNFDVVAQTAAVTFPRAGEWRDYLTDARFAATGNAQTITLQPGEYHLYINRDPNGPAANTPVPPDPEPEEEDPGTELKAQVYPNPGRSDVSVRLHLPEAGAVRIEIIGATGQRIGTAFSGTLNRGVHQVAINDQTSRLPAGLFFVLVTTAMGNKTLKLHVP